MKENLLHQRFGKLEVIDEAPPFVIPSGHKQRAVLCKCDCGVIKRVRASHLKRGSVKSCGCSTDEFCRKARTRHGESYTRLWYIWRGMKGRCYYEKHIAYNKYGGRGIVICDEWRNSFLAFREWALHNGYKDGLTIDRIDNEANYEPNNCRFVSYAVQNVNKRNNHFVNFAGERHTISEWSKILGIPVSRINSRLMRGWNEKDAISIDEPLNKYGEFSKYVEC